MKARSYKKLVTCVLSLAMILSTTVIPVQATSNCTHHQHNDACGYPAGGTCTFDPTGCEACQAGEPLNAGSTGTEGENESGAAAQSAPATAALSLEEGVEPQIQTMAENETFSVQTTDATPHILRCKILSESGTSGTVEITQMYGEASGSLTIPDTVERDDITYAVTAIGANVFYDCSGFTGNLVVGSNVATIGDGAFMGCTGFTGRYFMGNAPAVGTDIFDAGSAVLYREKATGWDAFPAAYPKSTFNVITLAETDYPLIYGDSVMLRPNMTPAEYKGSPAWVSNNAAVATVQNGGFYHGLMVAVGVGSTTITGTLLGESMTCTVTVAKDDSETIGVGAYHGSTPAFTFAYGDIISVHFTPSRSYGARAFSMTTPAVNEAALFLGTTLLGAPVAASEGTPGIIHYDTTDKMLLPDGTQQVLTVKYGGSGNLNASQGDVRIVLQKGDPEVQVSSDPASGVYGDSFTLKATVTGPNDEKPTGTVIFKNSGIPLAAGVSVTDGVATCQLSAPGANTYSITAEFTPDAESGKYYNSKTSEAHSLIVGKPTATITNKNYKTNYTYTGQAITVPKAEDFTITAGAGAVSFEWFKNNMSMGSNVPTEAGDYQLAVKTADMQNVAASEQRFDVTIAKMDQAVLSINEVTGKTYGDAAFALSVTGGSAAGTVTYTVPENNGVLTINGADATIVGAGTVTVTATMAGNGNYKDVTTTRDITIAKANQAVLTIGEVTGKTYGDAAFALSATGGSTAGAVTYTVADNNGVLTIKGSDATIVGAGTVTLTATMAGNANYKDATATRDITIAKANQAALAIGEVTGKTYGDAPFALSATGGTTAGAVSYTVADNNGVLTIKGSDATIVGAGTVTVTATMAGNANYKDVTVTRDVTIAKANQAALAIGEVTGKTYGDAPFALSATGGTTAGTVTYTVADNNGVLTINGTNATIVGAGTVTVTATMVGNGNYKDVTTTRDITIAKAAAEAMSIIPKTGDTMNLYVMLLLLALSGLVAATTLTVLKKRKSR